MSDGDLNDSIPNRVLKKSFARISRKQNKEKHIRGYECTYVIRKNWKITDEGLIIYLIYRVCKCGLHEDKSSFNERSEASRDEIENGALEVHFNSRCHYHEYETEDSDINEFQKVCYCPKEEIHNDTESWCILL